MGESRIAYKFLVGRTEEEEEEEEESEELKKKKKKKKRLLGRYRRRSKHNIEMYLIEIVCDGACCINLFQHRS
jgi:hypothetical protein